ncbi:MAG TPA: hypothetical protein VGY99_14000 [Candidatus Binataceae bacterium]|jgi:hypothetical protein|nr:hypothetical protein [Candidatus Binataceae bacterium]HZY58520.1 hypothetical protein [Candidatus Binataceae bacterium]
MKGALYPQDRWVTPGMPCGGALGYTPCVLNPRPCAQRRSRGYSKKA